MKRKRLSQTFNLSFLDVMSCGFGAVVLIFLIVDHASSTLQNTTENAELAEARLLEEDIEREQRLIVEALNSQQEVEQEITEISGVSQRLQREVAKLKEELAEEDAESLAKLEHIKQLKTEIKNLEEKLDRLRSAAEEGQGRRSRFIYGEGERQYLTGLRVGGDRILILLDASASMLDRTVVNILRLRNLPPEKRRGAPKWQSMVGTMDWLTAQLPNESLYQIYAFNTEVWPVLKGTEAEWLSVADTPLLEEAMDEVRRLVPTGGTSLVKAFEAVDRFVTQPDNIILITDGLPTQGAKAGSGKVNAEKRLKFFESALRALPEGIPVSVILAPMEGDPVAAAAYWNLAIRTNGAFMSPSRDWP